MFANACNRHLLIRAIRDFIIDSQIGDVLAISTLDHQLQLINCMISHQFAVWINSVYYFQTIPVRIVQHRGVTIFSLHAFAIETYLVPPLLRRNTCLFGFNNSQGSPVAPKQYIITEPLSSSVGHPLHFNFNAGFACDTDILFVTNIPTCLSQIQVDINLSCLRLAHVIGTLCIEFCPLINTLLENILCFRFDLDLLFRNRWMLFFRFLHQRLIKSRIIFYEPQKNEHFAHKKVEVLKPKHCLARLYLIIVGGVIS